MFKYILTFFCVCCLALQVNAKNADFVTGKPDIKSMSTLTFNSEGVLFVGDSRGAAVYAIDLDDKVKNDTREAVGLKDVEGQIAAMLGTTADAILVHDMAVNPISKNIYLAISRASGRKDWDNKFTLPNDLGDASILMKISPTGEIDEVALESVKYSKAALSNPVDESKTHMWKKGLSLRVDTITDIVFSDGKLFVAGLSNEEFASTMWQLSYPFEEKSSRSTVEIFHGAHGKYETHAPIRTFLPYKLKDEMHLLAAYLCTPLVTIPVSDLKDGQHIKGKTVAEFGSGNYPLDMVVYQKKGKEYILLTNSNLPFMIIDPDDVANYEGEITEEVEGYVAGVDYAIRSGSDVEQFALFNDTYMLGLQRQASGKLNLYSYPIERF